MPRWELDGRAGCRLDGAASFATAGRTVAHSSLSSPKIAGLFPFPHHSLQCGNINLEATLAVPQGQQDLLHPQRAGFLAKIHRKWSAGSESHPTLVLVRRLSGDCTGRCRD